MAPSSNSRPQAGPYWSFSRNMSVGVLVSMIVYGVILVNMISSMRSDISYFVEEFKDHEVLPAHGDVRIALTDLDVRLRHIETWKKIGGRFTDRDGDRLEARIKNLETLVERIQEKPR